MNCANHPDTPVAAYCQFCGKPLCASCAHKINNIVGCEPCLAARIGAAGAQGTGFQFTQTPEGMYVSDGTAPPQPSCCTQPWLAFCLGWIPGVGAMYNGQFAKALVHVFVFAILIDISNHHDAFGIVVAAWVFYQVFDAYQTTVARRDGLPLPNPLGLNDVSHWFGVKTISPSTVPNVSTPHTYQTYPPQPAAPANPNQPSAETDMPGGSRGFSAYSPASDSAPYVAPSIPPVPPDQVDYPELRRGIPTGAVVLIVIGLAFLLGNMGILSDYWMERGWPLVLIGVGVWLVIRRSQTPPAGGVR